MLEFGTTGFYPPLTGASMARRSEELGFDIQLFSENHSRVPDCFGEMRDAVSATSRITLLCGPLNFITRNPGVIAASITPLQVMSAGRAICGVASGDSAVAAVGRRPQRVDEMEASLRVLRALLHPDMAELPDGYSRLEWTGGLEVQPIPIQMMCSGPRSIAVAARSADRIGLSVGANPERIRWAMNIISASAKEAGRSRGDLRVGAFIPLAITSDRASGRQSIRPRVAGWAHMSSFGGNDLSAQPPIMRRVTTQLRERYDYRYHHPGAPANNPNSQIPDEEFGDWFGIGGPPSYVVERMTELVELGIEFFVTALPEIERERYAAEVMPVLRAHADS